MKIAESEAIKAYKVFDSDGTCRGFQYEPGKSYHHTGAIEVCRSGFHACSKLIDCFDYYSFDPANKVAIVRLWGNVEEDDNKLVANNIHIEKELSWNEVLNIVNKGKGNTGNRNDGHYNSGDRNTGSYNTGRCNVGNYNAGSYNVGDWNTGTSNIGGYNSGDYNVGSHNVGKSNTGDYNMGSFNIGNYNSGNFNIGDYHTGWFNTESTGDLYWFNKPVKPRILKTVHIPTFLRSVELTIWKHESLISSAKCASPEADVERQGGCLVSRTLKEAIRESFRAFDRYSWQSTWVTEIAAVKLLPNFDPDIFYEITGIKISELG